MNIVKDSIDEMLKADAALHDDVYIDDAGFTLRVIDALPGRSPVSTSIRLAILSGFTLVATMIVALFAGGGNFLIDAVMDIATNSMTQTAVTFIVVVGLMTVISIAVASDN